MLKPIDWQGEFKPDIVLCKKAIPNEMLSMNDYVFIECTDDIWTAKKVPLTEANAMVYCVSCDGKQIPFSNSADDVISVCFEHSVFHIQRENELGKNKEGMRIVSSEPETEGPVEVRLTMREEKP